MLNRKRVSLLKHAQRDSHHRSIPRNKFSVTFGTAYKRENMGKEFKRLMVMCLSLTLTLSHNLSLSPFPLSSHTNPKPSPRSEKHVELTSCRETRSRPWPHIAARPAPSLRGRRDPSGLPVPRPRPRETAPRGRRPAILRFVFGCLGKLQKVGSFPGVVVKRP